MELLFVTPRLPSPPGFGAQRRLHELMRGIARHHNVSVISFFDPKEDMATALAATKEYCCEVVTVRNGHDLAGGAQKRLSQLRSVLSSRSYESRVYMQPRFGRALRALLARRRFDVVQFELAPMAEYLPAVPNGPRTCLDEHNVEYDILRRTARAGTGTWRRAYSALNWRKVRREEMRAWRRAHGCVLTSSRDEAMLRCEVGAIRTAIVPNGVDVEQFAPGTPAREAGSVLFFGALSYYPNTDGVLYFLREIFPRIKATLPGVTFEIVGQHPPPRVARWPDPAVRVIGYVDDVREAIARASVVVVPLRIGGGTRLKVLEAMSMGKAVVSTTLGVEGIDVVGDRHVLIADEPSEFARTVVRALGDDVLRRRLGTAARALAVERYSWRSAVDKLAEFHGELVAGKLE